MCITVGARMEKAKIALIEDNERIRTIAKSVLEGEDHTVVAEAATLEQALEVVDNAATGDLTLDVVFLDGKLRKDAALGEDASIISRYMRDRHLAAHVIGFSMSELPEDVCDAAVENKDVIKALDIIKDLPEPI